MEYVLCNRYTIDIRPIGNGLDTPENHRILSFYTVSAMSGSSTATKFLFTNVS
jgi:hypothetical protein